MTRTTMKWLAGLFAVAALLALWALAPLDRWSTALNDYVDSLGMLGLVVFGTVYAVATVLMMPGSVLTLAAGLTFGLWAFPLVVVSASIGACLAFLTGRYLARKSVEARFSDSRRFRAIDRAVRDEGWKIVGLLRLSPLVPFNLQNYLFGLTDIRFVHYALATFFGIMPGTLMYVYFGAAGRMALGGGESGGNDPLRWTLFSVGLIATIVVTVLITRKARDRLSHSEAGEPLAEN